MFPFTDIGVLIMIYILIAAITLVADILTKIAAAQRLAPLYSIEVIKDILNLTYVENRGIAFGMFQGQRVVFIIISILVICLILWVIVKMSKEKKSAFLMLGGALTISGAIGNLIDRTLYGYVVDFIEVKFIEFPVFNIADIAVCVGAALLVIHFLFIEGKNDNKEEKSDE